MATWYDIPAEVKQNILEYLIDGLHAKFEPRHAATRATRNVNNKEKDQEAEPSRTDWIVTLLLVSKHFVTYNELEGALLTNAVISIEDARAFIVLGKRYGKDGLAMIQNMVVCPKITRREMRAAQRKFPDLHQMLRTKMPNMRRIVISLTHWTRNRFGCWLSHDQVIEIAKGHPLRSSDLSDAASTRRVFRHTNDVAAAARKLTQEFLCRPLVFVRRKQEKWLTELSDTKDYSSCEVILEWEMTFAAEDMGLEHEQVRYCA